MNEEKYIVLAGNNHYPCGWDDFKGVHEDFAKAKAWAVALSPERGGGWYQIISTKTWLVVYEEHR